MLAALTDREMDAALRSYEGLVKKTALLLLVGEHPDCHGRGGVQEPLEDMEQLLLMKAWKAIRSFDASRSKSRGTRGRSPLDLYVNMCLRDQAKDIIRRDRTRHSRGELMIEDIAPANDNGNAPQDKFHARYLSQGHEETFSHIEEELPLIPSTLTERERHVLVLMYRDHKQTEIAVIMGVTKREVESAVRGIRSKFADWKPATDAVGEGDELAALAA